MAALTTSDFIAIIGTSVQVVTAVGVAVWQVRRKAPNAHVSPAKQARGLKFDWRYFLRESWQYFFCIVVATFALWATLASSEALSKSFVVQIVAYSFLLVFGLLGAIVMLVVTALLPAFAKLTVISERWQKTDASQEGDRDV